MVPEIRVRHLTGEVRPQGACVVYWMTAARRTHHNMALEYACRLAEEFQVPLVIFEALRVGYCWASDRLHAFVLQGMVDNRESIGDAAFYYPYVEPDHGAGKGLLRALSESAVAIVTDRFPAFFLPRMLQAAAEQVSCALYAVDGNGLLPLDAAERPFTTAYSFRRFLHKTLPAHLGDGPVPDPLSMAELAPASDAEAALASVLERWPAWDTNVDIASAVAGLPIDHSVPIVADVNGGARAGAGLLEQFIDDRLADYGADRNHPERNAASELSAHLHYGHVGAHQVWNALITREDWTPERIADKPTGQRAGFWGMSENAEGFLDEVLTWRELGYVFCDQVPGYQELASLPDWATKTIEKHAGDDREYVYSLEEFERGRTHDELWNAAQGELVERGRIHNYLRMLWGKKIYEWSASADDALATMIELNNKYALDGRDPNSYSGIFWVLGRFDRAWGPERPIFGKLRYMTSASTRKKTSVDGYIRRFKGAAHQASLL